MLERKRALKFKKENVGYHKEEMMIKPDEKIPKGYVVGRLQSKAFAGGKGRHSAKGTKWWNNGAKELMSENSPGPSFVTGRLKKDPTFY